MRRPRERPAVVRQILSGPVLEHLETMRQRRPFVGSPLAEADLQETADAVARMFRLVELMERIASRRASANQVHSLVMAVWAGGFKAGVEYEKRAGS